MLQHYMQASTMAVLAVLTVAPSSEPSTRHRAAQPPSSLRPDPQKRTVRISHRHERVRRCATLRVGERFQCAPILVDADTAATIAFQLVAPPSSTVKSSGQPVVVTLPSLAGPQDSAIELSLGQWLVDWQGYGIIKRLQIASASTPVVSLRTRSGRCETTGNRCRLDSDTVSRKMTIVDERP